MLSKLIIKLLLGYNGDFLLITVFCNGQMFACQGDSTGRCGDRAHGFWVNVDSGDV